MPAIRGKSLTAVFTAPGSSLREADSTASAIVTSGPWMYPITGYRSGDAERERLPAEYSVATRSVTLAALRGIFPERVDRDSVFLRNPPGPEEPGYRKEWIAGLRGIARSNRQDATMMSW
jgi:hypothetical protein